MNNLSGIISIAVFNKLAAISSFVSLNSFPNKDPNNAFASTFLLLIVAQSSSLIETKNSEESCLENFGSIW
jgi:hypothetical protein